MDWTAVLSNPTVLQIFIGLLVATSGYLFKKLGITIDPELLRATCDEVVSYLRTDADSVRGADGKIPTPQLERLGNEAIKQVRVRLKDKKPPWLPGFIWNWALKRITAHLIRTMIEGALKVYKQRHR